MPLKLLSLEIKSSPAPFFLYSLATKLGLNSVGRDALKAAPQLHGTSYIRGTWGNMELMEMVMLYVLNYFIRENNAAGLFCVGLSHTFFALFLFFPPQKGNSH